MQLCDICELEKYICVFQDYYYHIFNQVSDSTNYLPLFFAKIPDPWGSKLIETYSPGNLDTLGRRIAHAKDKLSSWCADALLAKASRGLRKRNLLCCKNPKMPIMIGCDSPYYYGKIKRKLKKGIEKDILRKEKFVIIRNEVIKNLKDLPLGEKS